MPIYTLMTVSTILATFFIAGPIRRDCMGEGKEEPLPDLPEHKIPWPRLLDRFLFAVGIGAFWFFFIPAFVISAIRGRRPQTPQ